MRLIVKEDIGCKLRKIGQAKTALEKAVLWIWFYPAYEKELNTEEADTDTVRILHQAVLIHVGYLICAIETDIAIDADLTAQVKVEFLEIELVMIFLFPSFIGYLFGPGIEAIAAYYAQAVGNPEMVRQAGFKVNHQWYAHISKSQFVLAEPNRIFDHHGIGHIQVRDVFIETEVVQLQAGSRI